ncbi:MAG: hypothetical protein ACXU8A_00060 [Burkholderiaceae bacterium]
MKDIIMTLTQQQMSDAFEAWVFEQISKGGIDPDAYWKGFARDAFYGAMLQSQSPAPVSETPILSESDISITPDMIEAAAQVNKYNNATYAQIYIAMYLASQPTIAASPAGCKQCPHVIGDAYQRDCQYPDCSHAGEVGQLPERVIDTLIQTAGISTYHPDGDQLTKLHNLVQIVINEFVSRQPQQPAPHKPSQEQVREIQKRLIGALPFSCQCGKLSRDPQRHDLDCVTRIIGDAILIFEPKQSTEGSE